MYTLAITGETICEIIDQLDKRINEFESLANMKLKSMSPVEPVKKTKKETPAPSVAVEMVVEVKDANGVTFNDIKIQILNVAKEKGRQSSLEILQKFLDVNGKPCEKITALLEKDYADVMAEAKAVLSA